MCVVRITSCILIFICWGPLSLSFSQIPDGYEKGLNYINSDDIKNSISFLASDELEGRATGSQGNLEAARFIAKKFFEAGLIPYQQNKGFIPVADNEDEENIMYVQPKESEKPDFYDRYFQKFFLTESKINKLNTSLAVSKRSNGTNKELFYQLQKDFAVSYKSSHGISLEAPIVFAGYGINKGELNYNDYVDENGKEIDVKDKIVLIIEGFPRENNPNSDFSKSKNILYKNVRKKLEIAMEKGAIGILVAQSPLKQNPPFPVKFENMSNAFLKSEFGLPELQSKSTIPLIYISNDVVKDLFVGCKKSLSELLTNIERELNPYAFSFTESSIKINIHLDVELISTQNVIGLIEGTDAELKNEFIVVGAHYDHVGFGNYGAMDKHNTGQIHNGADDNASGTSGLIELAEAFSKCKPKRSVIFIAFSGEENGILGSRFYAYQDPFKKIERTIATVNLDMIGRNEPELVWVGGIFYSEDLKKIVQDANTKIGFELLYNVGLLTFASDQGPFIRKGVPSLFFFSGLHDDYHTPSDDADRIDFDKAERIVKLAYLSGWILTNQDTRPKYREATMDEKIILVKESLDRQKKYRPDEKK
jgi:aminopeptidase YwaD